MGKDLTGKPTYASINTHHDIEYGIIDFIKHAGTTWKVLVM